MAKVHPSVEWAQRNDKLYVTVFIEDVNRPNVEMTDDKLIIKGTGGQASKVQEYECEIEFYKPINSEACKRNVSGRFLSFMIPKQDTGPYWPRLLKSDKKVHWLKVDFDKWKDEDDEESDLDNNDMGFGDMMSNVNPYDDLDGEEDGDYGGDEENEEDDLPENPESLSSKQKPNEVDLTAANHEHVVETAS